MSLKQLNKSLGRGEILLPKLRNFLSTEKAQLATKETSRKAIKLEDCKLSIAAFQEQIDEFNHGEELEGELFHPSGLGYCLRRSWFKHFKAPEDRVSGRAEDDLRTHCTFETGTYFHVLFQNVCARAGLLLQREAAFIDHKEKLVGHADGVLLLDGVRTLLEIKTISSRGFTGVVAAPEFGHKQQMHAYMHCLGLKQGVIVYFNKDSSELREHFVEFDPEFYKVHVKQRVSYYFDSLRKVTAPRREGENTECAMCRWCPYKNTCFGFIAFEQFTKGLKGANEPKKNKTSGRKISFSNSAAAD